MSIFTRNAMVKPKSSWFGLSHTNTLTLDMPYLTPVLCRDVIPGDTWKISTEMFMRMQPLLAPIMQDVDVYCHYFYVPLRIMVQDYDKWFNPEDQEEVFRPFIDPSGLRTLLQAKFGPALNTPIPLDPSQQGQQDKEILSYCKLFAEGSLADYLGIPVVSLSNAYGSTGFLPVSYLAQVALLPKFSAVPFLMYHKIYDEFYRDQTLELSVLDSLDLQLDGYLKGKFNTDEPFDIISLEGWKLLMSIRTRAWKKDYFTSALPTPQSGPDVHLPLTGDADVVLKPIGEGPVVYPEGKFVLSLDGSVPSKKGFAVANNVNGGVSLEPDYPDPDMGSAVYDPNGSLQADLSSVTSATINELRRAVRAQEFLEKCARGGRRYIEMILSHFGVRSSDARLDRPEFLGGGRQPFTISEVLSHVGESEGSTFVLGEMGGHGVSYGNSRPTKRFFEEHGYIFAIVSVLPKASYQQGLERHWSRETIYDYAWPTFANLGEQEILNQEIFALSGNKEGTFGYAPRYSEYKYIPSSVHGSMRSDLNYWHLGRIFASEPALNGDFVHPRPEELKRIFAVQDDTQSIIALVKHHIQCKRRLPKYGIPTL